MDNEGILVTLQDEVNYCKIYIEIQKVRYKDKFQVQWNIPNELLNVKVPKLFIQPLIENSIYHGIKPTGYNGIIVIEAYQTGDGMVISVLDDGIGISAEDAQIITQNINGEETGNRIGLHNVCRRVKLIFGENWGVEMKSLMKGAMVNIYLPIIR